MDHLLQRAIKLLSHDQVVAIANELRSAGRDEAAFGLYIAAVEATSAQAPDDVAQLVHAMARSGHEAYSRQLAKAALEARADAADLNELASAYWRTEQDAFAQKVLEHAAATLADSEVARLIELLVGQRRPEAAVELCLLAARTRPPRSTLACVTALRELGRPLDAKSALEGAVAQMPATELAHLAAIVSEGDRRRIISIALQRPSPDVAALIEVAVDLSTPQTQEAIVEALVKDGPAQLAERVAAIGDGLRPIAAAITRQMAADDIACTIANTTAIVSAECLAIAMTTRSDTDAILRYISTEGLSLPDGTVELVAQRHIDVVSAVLPALHRVGMEHKLRYLLERSLRAAPSDLRMILATLAGLGRADELETMTNNLASRTPRERLRDLLLELTDEPDHALCARLAAAIVRHRSPVEVDQLRLMLQGEAPQDLVDQVDSTTQPVTPKRKSPPKWFAGLRGSSAK